MFKAKLLAITLLLCSFSSSAQKESNITLRIEPGFLLMSESENLGLLLNVEPKINTSELAVIGLRFGLALNSQKFDLENNARFNIDEQHDNAVISFVPTFDYYFNKNRTRPYLGVGLGYYLFSQIDLSNPSEEGNVNNQVGFLVRGGFELGKTRLGLEYNLVPKADIEIPAGETVGTVENSYLGLSIGFTIGGGKG